jgi:hypothetical protein
VCGGLFNKGELEKSLGGSDDVSQRFVGTFGREEAVRATVFQPLSWRLRESRERVRKSAKERERARKSQASAWCAISLTAGSLLAVRLRLIPPRPGESGCAVRRGSGSGSRRARGGGVGSIDAART